MTYLRNNLKNRVFDLVRDRKGAISVEFAIISPFLISALLVASNMAFSVMNHQKLAAAANASAAFIQDEISEHGLKPIGQEEYDKDGNPIDNELKRTARLIIEESFGKELSPTEASVEFYCACPPPLTDMKGFYAGEQPYYNFSAVSMGNGNNVCPDDCESWRTDPQRVIAKIEIDYQTYNLFGQSKTVSEEIVTRLK